jgi:choice-of-anchor C domain-containing protein
MLNLSRTAFVLALMSVPGICRANLVTNGSFETPSAGNQFITFAAPTTFGGWTVAANTVDLVGPGQFMAADGSQSVDLSGTSADPRGAIFQDLSTAAGQSYTLQFELAGNPLNQQGVKEMAVYWGDASGPLIEVGMFTFDTTGRSASNAGWVSEEIDGLTATSSSMRLQFASLTDSLYGPTIDSVSVSSVPEPSSLISFLLGAAPCVMLCLCRKRNG